MMNKTIPSAEHLRSFLLKIYPCKVPFELQVINKKPKTRLGSYSLKKRRIHIYAPWISECTLEEIAIHEYAHHIQNTEKGGIWGRGKERAHGQYFWCIYSALVARAIELNLYDDELISDIILPRS